MEDRRKRNEGLHSRAFVKKKKENLEEEEKNGSAKVRPVAVLYTMVRRAAQGRYTVGGAGAGRNRKEKNRAEPRRYFLSK